jgi:hypothetical protein
VSTARLAEEVRRLRERRRLSRHDLPQDRVVFAETLGIVPDPWQADLLRSPAPRILLNCCRQSGKSTMTAIIALHRALFHLGSLILILAPSERQAKETFGKLTGFYRQLGHPVASESYRRMGLELMNGSRVEALPGTEKTVRGFSAVDLLILDEAARVEDDLYHATRPMLAVSGGSLIMLSTPFGKRGIFHEEWTSGRSWDKYEVPASQCPRITAEFLEEERFTLGDWAYQQEYECRFMQNLSSVFDEAAIERALSSSTEPMFPDDEEWG